MNRPKPSPPSLSPTPTPTPTPTPPAPTPPSPPAPTPPSPPAPTPPSPPAPTPPSPPAPTPPSGSCPHTYSSSGKCPTLSQSNVDFPPPINQKLPKCELVGKLGTTASYKKLPCINTEESGGANTSGSESENLYKACFKYDNSSDKVKSCPIGSHCVAKENNNQPGYSSYSQCLPYCETAVISSCCNLKDGCSNCVEMPSGGNCNNIGEFVPGSKWLKSKLTNVCSFKAKKTGLYYYDGGNGCNKLICEQNKGTWQSVNNVNFNKNIYVNKTDDLSSLFELTDPPEKINGQDIYTIKDKIKIIPGKKKYDCNYINSIIDKNNNIYTLVSSKPKYWYCPSFSKWDDCSYNACVSNCENNTIYSNCNELCKSVNLTDPNLEVPASTTDFGFGAATSCMCDGSDVMNSLTNYNGTGKPYKIDGNEDGSGYWVGVATPSWIQSPFNVNTYSGLATGQSTIASEYGQKYTSNCSIGNGGCGTCWELTRTDGPKQKINAVVIDTCEDKNAYGNNYNWCVAQRPDVKNFIPNPNATYAGNWPTFFSELPLTSTNTKNQDGNMIWKAENDNCTDKDGNFICKNMDFHPVHFDVATQQVPSELVQQIGIWPESTNPKVTARRIKCPDKLKQDILTKHCGSNAKSKAKPSEYCKGHGKKMCYSSTNPDGLWPESDCQAPPPPPPGPPPGPTPSKKTGKTCYYNNCIDKKNCQKIYSQPEDYCKACSQTQYGPNHGPHPEFTGVKSWDNVDWTPYSNINEWYKSKKNFGVYCEPPLTT